MSDLRSQVYALSLATGCASILVMGLVHALVNGNWSVHASELLENPWGVATLIEAYIGFVFVAVWIACRERRAWMSVVWILMLFTIGNLVAALYVTLELWRCRGDTRRFWLGSSRSESID